MGRHSLGALRLHRDESGVAMITVVAMAGIMLTLTLLIASRSMTNFTQVRSERQFEQSLHVADSGVDNTLFRLTKNRAYTTGETAPPFDPTDPVTERDWVLNDALDPSNPLVTTAEGQWQIVKPSNTQVIYSVGAVPSFADPQKIRVIRATYDFPPFVPGAAILTDGDLRLNGTNALTGAAGTIHSNQDVEVIGNLSTSGWVTAGPEGTVSGDVQECTPPAVEDCDPANTGGGRPELEVPDLSPRNAYYLSQYDLCPGGEVRRGPAFAGPVPPSDDLVPCTGALLSPAGANAYRGWDHRGSSSVDGDIWRYNSGTANPGVYYIYNGSAVISGSPGSAASPWETTILAEASAVGDEPNHCPHTGGDITISGSPKLRYHPNTSAAGRLLLIAGRDLDLGGSASAGGTRLDGFLYAHEQFEASGNVSVFGPLIAYDKCDTPQSAATGSPSVVGGGVTFHYDGNYEINLGNRIRTTHWLEI